MSKKYGISEIAKELGVSRQTVFAKVKKCENPYIKFDKGRKLAPPIEIQEITIPGWICPNCHTPNATYKSADDYKSRVVCRKCKKTFRVIAPYQKK